MGETIKNGWAQKKKTTVVGVVVEATKPRPEFRLQSN